MRVVLALLCLLAVATSTYAQPRDQTATGMEAGYWLTAYEHRDREWNTMAASWVHGFIKAATMFGGVQCPQELSVRTLAAATADVIKQRKRPQEDAAVAVVVAAGKLGCSVDTEAIRRAADLLEKKWGTK
jgi:hypothetical protein